MPNYNAGIEIYTLSPSQTVNYGYHVIYTASENGYISVYDCANNRDYYLFVNFKALHKSVASYHKCIATNAGNGMFPITKGDVLTMLFVTNDTLGHKGGSTNIWFIPGKIVEN